jgi:hypothetical protein
MDSQRGSIDRDNTLQENQACVNVSTETSFSWMECLKLKLYAFQDRTLGMAQAGETKGKCECVESRDPAGSPVARGMRTLNRHGVRLVRGTSAQAPSLADSS